MAQNVVDAALAWFRSRAHAPICLAQQSAGGDVNARDSRGVTPLILASLQSHVQAVQCLLAYGARVDMRSVLGRTAEMVAPNEQVRTILRAAAAQSAPSAPLPAASRPAAPIMR